MWNKSMQKNAEMASFYHFWAWEYVRRNAGFRELMEWVEKADATLLCPENEEKVSAFLVEQGAKAPDEPYDPMVSDAVRLRGLSLARYGFYPEGPMGRPYTSGEIVSALCNEEPLDRPLVGRYFPKMAESLAFRHMENGKKIIEFGGERIEGRDVLLAVSLDMPVKAIVAELEDLLKACQYRDRFERGMGGEEVDYGNDAEAERIRKGDGIAFRPGKEGARALGLWLWDYLDECDGLQDRGLRAEAIRAMKEDYDPATLGYYVSEDDVFFRWIRQTIKCVDSGEVDTVG